LAKRTGMHARKKKDLEVTARNVKRGVMLTQYVLSVLRKNTVVQDIRI
jgi:hypothetical protein